MANIFQISTANDTLKVDPNGRTEAVFTVSNHTGRPVRGLAVLRPLDNTKQEWLKLAGENERDFVAAGTQQFTVRFEPPPNTPPGKYRFRLDVVSTVNPDENFTEGPTVVAEVSAPKPPPAPSKAWMIPVALIALLLMVGTTVVIVKSCKNGPEAKVMPKVLNKTLEEAKAVLEPLHLDVVQDPELEATLDFDAGKVAVQTPNPGEPLESVKTVKLKLAGPSVKVPQVNQQPLQPAMKMIVDADLVPNAPVGSQLDGVVQSSDPPQGTLVLKGRKVTLVMPQAPCVTRLCKEIRLNVDRQFTAAPLIRPSP
jgi:PASTA domain